MNNELIKELSRLQLLSSRCKNKMSKCPLSITLEENRAYLIFNYIKELKEDISFCLHSIKQEMEMSTDSRTRSEMTSCYEILKRWNK